MLKPHMVKALTFLNQNKKRNNAKLNVNKFLNNGYEVKFWTVIFQNILLKNYQN